MKKLLILLIFTLSSTLFANPWDCYSDDPGLRKRFDSINKQYFNSELKVDYINFNNELPDDSFAITYHWSPYTAFPDREVIAVNPKLMEKDESTIMSVIAHECCHVYVDQNDPEVRYYGYTCDGHNHEMFHAIMKKLHDAGCTLWIPLGWEF